MSPGFLVLAGVLAALAVVPLLRPLLRGVEGKATLTAAAVAVLLFSGAGGLYVLFSDFDWNSPPPEQTPAVQAAALAKRLAKDPEDLAGWLELGEQYTALDQYPLAARAYARADVVAKGRSAPAILGLAESLLTMDIEGIRGQSGRLFDRVLEIEPRNLKGLFYGAIAAFARGESDLGRERFQQLLALDPPENIRLIIEKQLQALDAQQSAGGAGDRPDAAATGEATVQVRVSIAPSLRYQLTPRAALFVLARDPDQPGPPFAAKRLPVELPADVTLSAADAMLEQRRIAAGQRLQVVARISLDGQPQSATGDPFGQVSYHVGRDGKLNLVIDQLAP